MKTTIGMILMAAVFLGCGLFGWQPEAEQGPVLRQVDGFCYAYMDFVGPYSLIGEKVKIFSGEFRKQGLEATGDFLVIYYNSPRYNKKEDLRWAPSFPIKQDTEVKPPLKKGVFKQMPCVVGIHTGPLEEIQQTNDKVKAYIDDNGYRMVWPAYEVFYANPEYVKIGHPVTRKK